MNGSAAPTPKSPAFQLLEGASGRKVAQEGGAELTQEQKRTARLKASLPRGITIGFRPDGREKPFFVRFGPGRITESFPSERARNTRAEALAKGVEQEGTAVLNYDPAEWREYQQFKQRTGITLAEAEAIISRVRGNLKLNLTGKEAVASYKALRAAEGLEDDGHTDLHLDRFVEACGYLPLFAVQPEHIRAWLAAIGLGAVTVRHHRKTVYAFFERAMLEKWCFENPVKAVAPPKVDDSDTTVLPARELFALLKANRDEPIAPKLALELYGFLRCSSVERVQKAHIRFESRGIEMKGTLEDEETGEKKRGHKSGKRKFRQGQPPVLWDWLAHAGEDCWTAITEKNYDEKKAEAFIRAGVKNPGNVLRHTCASVALAATRNPPYVSYMMQHTSLSMTEKYEGVYEEHAARLVLAMTPAAVLLEWDDFCARWAEFYQPIPLSSLPSTTAKR